MLKENEKCDFYVPSKNYIIVNDEESFEKMVCSMEDKILIGVDV